MLSSFMVVDILRAACAEPSGSKRANGLVDVVRWNTFVQQRKRRRDDGGNRIKRSELVEMESSVIFLYADKVVA
jgi:hypothetical protein